MWAVGYGQLNTAKLLINAGADLNYKGNTGETSLHLAAAHGHHDLVKLLLSYGADPNLTDDVFIHKIFNCCKIACKLKRNTIFRMEIHP